MEYLQQMYISKMVVTRMMNIRNLLSVLILFASGLTMAMAFALDNPDAPDLIMEFEQREQNYLERINNPNNSTRANLIAYDDYLIFLDAELNNAYKLVKSKLPEDRQQELKKSQQFWVLFKDAEFELIKNTWTKESFGSSSAISRGSYRSSVVKNRVIQLLHYANNY